MGLIALIIRSALGGVQNSYTHNIKNVVMFILYVAKTNFNTHISSIGAVSLHPHFKYFTLHVADFQLNNSCTHALQFT